MADYLAIKANKSLKVTGEREATQLAGRGFNIYSVDAKGSKTLHKAGTGQTVSLDAHEKLKAEKQALEKKLAALESKPAK